MHLYAAAVMRPITNSLCYVVYKMLPNNTDFTVFKAASYQGFNFAFIGDVGHYHTPLDTWANASASTIQHQGDNALGAVLALANSTDLRPAAQDSVFFDVFARGVLVWPIPFVLPAALAALVLLLVEAVLLFRKGRMNGRQAAYGAIGAVANLVVGGALSLGVLALLKGLGRAPPSDAPPWIAHPLAMHVGFSALALLSAGAVGAWFARRAGFWGFWFGASLLIALLSVGQSLGGPWRRTALLAPHDQPVSGPDAGTVGDFQVNGVGGGARGAALFVVIRPGPNTGAGNSELCRSRARPHPVCGSVAPVVAAVRGARRTGMAHLDRDALLGGRLPAALVGRCNQASTPLRDAAWGGHCVCRDIGHAAASDVFAQLAAARQHRILDRRR